MHLKASSAVGALVATSGFALAAFIPTASAHRTAENSYTQYTECTTTTYSQYSQYCEPTTTTSSTGSLSTGGSSVATSTGTTAITTATHTTTTGTTGTTQTATTAGVTLGTDIVRTVSASAELKVGTRLAPDVTVISNHKGTLVVDDHGYDMTVPKGAVMTIAADGTMFVAKTGKDAGSDRIHIVGGKADTYYLQTANGVSFGFSHSTKGILKQISFTNPTKPVSASIYKISRPHGRLWISLAAALQNPQVSIESGVLEFTQPEAKYVAKQRVTRTRVTLTVTTKAGKVYKVTFLLPITEETVVPYK